MTGLWVKGKELSSGVPALPVGLAAVSPASWPALWEGVARAPATGMRAQGPEHRPEAAVSTQLPSMRQNPASSLHVSPWSQGGRIGGCLFIGVETPQAGLTLKPSNPQRTDEQKSCQDSFPPCSAVSVESLAGCASCCPLVRMARPLHGLHSGPQGRLWAGGAPWWVGQGWGEHRHPGVAARTWRGAVTGAGWGGEHVVSRPGHITPLPSWSNQCYLHKSVTAIGRRVSTFTRAPGDEAALLAGNVTFSSSRGRVLSCFVLGTTST